MLQRNCLLLLLLLPREHERHHGRVQDVHDTVSHRCAGAACTRGAQARLRGVPINVCVFLKVCARCITVHVARSTKECGKLEHEHM